MNIEQLEYHDRVSQWKLEPVEFSPNLNLLVGVSGAGKTKIIEAIQNLKAIANGKSFSGIKWNLKFSTKNNIKYQWKGEIEVESQLELGTNQAPYRNNKIINEALLINNELIIKRDIEDTYFKQKITPKLSPFKSILLLFVYEEDIQPILEELNQIIFRSREQTQFQYSWGVATRILHQYQNSSLNNLKQSYLDVQVKLLIVFKYFPDIFEIIKHKFLDFFSKIQDVKLEEINKNNIPSFFQEPDYISQDVQIKIKEFKVDNWIPQEHISSGILKTLMYISELYLCPDNSVILIDEFENSLGVNCLDSVTDLILENPHLQFIITSHHPYIINNISPEYWKIVTRRGSVVKVKTAEDFHISKSRQKAFIDLINVLEDDDEDWEDE